MSRLGGAAGWVLVAGLVGLATGRPAAAASPANGPPPPAAEVLVDRFAQALGERGGATDGPLALAFTARGGPGDAPAAGELGRLVDRLLASALRADGLALRVLTVPADPDRARAAAGQAGAAALLEVQLTRLEDRLLLAGTRTPLWENFWTGRPPGASTSVQVEVKTDADARLLARASLGGEPTRGVARLRPLLAVGGRPLAVAVGDLDGDGEAEGACLTDEALVVFRLEGTEPRVLARRDLTAAPPATTPARDPAGGVVVTRLAGTPVLAYHHSGLARGEALALDPGGLRFLTELDEVPLAAREETVLWARPVPGTNLFQGRLRVAARGAAPRWVEAGAPVVSATLTPEGDPWWVGADWRPGRPGPTPREPERVGAGLALADLGGAGRLRVLYSAPVAPGPEDLLWLADPAGPLVEARPVPGALRALGAGDLTGDGRDDVLVAAGGPEGGWLYLLTEDPS